MSHLLAGPFRMLATLLLLGSALVVAPVAVPAAVPSASATTTQADTARAAETGAQEAAACTASMTSLRYRHASDAAGSVYGKIVVTNTSGRTCTLHGYGGVSYVGHGDGTQIGAAAVRLPATVHTVRLRPGDSARDLVQMTNAQNYPVHRCRPRKVDGFRIYLPDETHSQYVEHQTTGCANSKIELLHVKPYHA